MTKLVFIFTLFMAMSMHSFGQTDSLAAVHFYSFEPEQGLKKTFQVLEDNQSLTNMEEGGEVLIQMEPGTYSFSLQPGSGSLPLNLQSGMTYFIFCTTTGTLIVRTQSEAESDLKKVRGN